MSRTPQRLFALAALLVLGGAPSCTQTPYAPAGQLPDAAASGPNGSRPPARSKATSVGTATVGVSVGAPAFAQAAEAEAETQQQSTRPAADPQRGGGGGAGGPGAGRTPAYSGPTSPIPKLSRSETQRLEGLSERARPTAADGGARARLGKANGGARVDVNEDDFEFRWTLEPAEGRRLNWIQIEEDDAVVAPFANSWFTPGEGQFQVKRASLRGGAFEVIGSDDVELRITPHGRSLEIELSGPPVADAVLYLGGLKALSGFEGLEIVQVPFFDVGHVGVLRQADGSVRYVSAWTDPGVSQGSPAEILEAGKVGSEREQAYSQRVAYSTSSEGETRPLRERIWVTYSDRLLDVLPSMAGDPAPLREDAARWFYLDLHLFPFDQADLALRQMHALGLHDVYVLMREWQRDGYDEGYPTSVLPPRAEWGGSEGLAQVSARAAEYGWLFGLHHNWIFNTEELEGATMLDGSGGLSTRRGGAQYLKPAFAAALVEDIEGAFHEQFDTTGTFSDSITAIVPPLDFDADEPDWGLFGHQWLTRAGILDELREIHGGPVTTEGSFGFGNLLWSGEVEVINGYVGMTTQAEAKSSLGLAVPAIPHFGLHSVSPKLLHMGVGQPPRYLFPTKRRITLAYGPEERDHLNSASLLHATAPFFWWIGLTRASEAARDYHSIAEPSRLLAQAGRSTLDVVYFDAAGAERTLEEMLARGATLLPGEVRLRVRHGLADGREMSLWVNLTPEVFALELADGREVAVGPYGHFLQAEGLEAGAVRQGGSTLEYCDGAEGLFVDGRGTAVSNGGLSTDGGAHVQRSGAGRARLTVLPEYAIARTAGESETLVAATFVELAPELLEELLGSTPERIEFAAYPLRAAADLPALEPLGVTLEPNGALRIDAAVWESRGAYALELVAAEPTSGD